MPRRDWRLRVEDILEAIGRIEAYTHTLTFDDCCGDSKTVDAVVRNLEVIGEAARTLDADVTAALPDVPWPDVRDMRNVLVHEYFGVDLAIVWATVKQCCRTDAGAEHLGRGGAGSPERRNNR